MPQPAPPTRDKIDYVLHEGFVRARQLAWDKDHEHIAELADALEIIPTLYRRWDDGMMAHVREIVSGYEAKYPETANRLTRLLDMSDEEFHALYLAPRTWRCDEVDAAAA